MYIYIYIYLIVIFLALRTRYKLEEFDAAIREAATIHHKSNTELDPEEGLFYRTFPWREGDLNQLIH